MFLVDTCFFASVLCQVDGVSGSYCLGVGVIVDKELGLVVVDRTTVQVALGDVMLTLNGSEVSALRAGRAIGGRGRGEGERLREGCCRLAGGLARGFRAGLVGILLVAEGSSCAF